MALDFAAGCVGGCAGLMVGYPLDTIKVHIQTQDHRNPQFKGTWHCFRTILARESVMGLYRGMTSPMAGVAVVNAIIFGVYGQTQRSLDDQDHPMTHFVAGASAGLAQSPICSPLELVKTRLQLQNSVGPRFKGPIHCLRHVYRNEGHRGVFSGLGITALRETPSFAVYFITYEALTRNSSLAEISTFHMLMAGGLAGTASWVATYPIDVIKSRLQADAHGRYCGAIDCLKKSVKNEGYSWLYRGLSATILRAFPTNAATFTVVTWIFRLFGQDDKTSGSERVSNPKNRDGQIIREKIQEEKLPQRNVREPRETFVNKCNSLVARVMEEYRYEPTSYYSANIIAPLLANEPALIEKFHCHLKQQRSFVGNDVDNESTDSIEQVSSIEPIDDSTGDPSSPEDGG